MPTSYRMYRKAPAAVVWTILKSWTHPMDAEPGPALIEINLGTAEERTDACAEITPPRPAQLPQSCSSWRTLPSAPTQADPRN